MADRAKELIKMGESLYSQRSGLMSLWQQIAEQLYVERADFTSQRTEGSIFADHLFTSYPLLARRELGNSFSSILRPRNAPWVSVHVDNEDLDNGTQERAYLEYMTKVQWRAMYDPDAKFVDATKQADHDVAAFGNAVIWCGLNSTRTKLLHINHHLRDCVWSENADGKIDALWRKWKPSARQLQGWFPKTMSAQAKDIADKHPDQKIDCYHIAVPTRLYQPDQKSGKRVMPWTCLYVEKETDTVLEEKGEAWFPFIVPRWATLSGTQYARSPATEIALPDVRTFQVMMRTLREAGEKHVDPPMIAVVDALRSDIQLYAGGITTVDIEYDQSTGAALMPVDRAPGGMPIGFEMAAALKDDIRLGFYLDKLTLPAVDPGKFTAYEFQQRVEQMAREGAPIFEPIEDNYNSPLVELDFSILKANGAFGPPEAMPPSLRGAKINFVFQSPFRDAQEQAKAGLFMDGLTRIVVPAAEVDPSQFANVNMTVGVQAALRSLGWPAEWINDPSVVAADKASKQQAAQAQAGVQGVNAMGQAAQSAGAGAAAIGDAGRSAIAAVRGIKGMGGLANLSEAGGAGG